jgi:hypothetical protein
VDELWLRVRWVFAGANDVHAEPGGVFGDGASDAAQADQAKDGPGDFSRTLTGMPCNFLSPDVLLLKAHGQRNFLSESKDQRDYVLGYDWAVDVAGVGEDDITVHEFGK